MKKGVTKIVAVVMALAIITLLVIMGPANAYNLSLLISNNSPSSGQLMSIIVSAKREETDNVDPDSFTLRIFGPDSITCNFYVNATKISGCDSLEIVRIDVNGTDNGYGYGYGNSKIFKYNVTFDPFFLKKGKYKTQFSTIINNKRFESETGSFTINLDYDSVAQCSVKGKDGKSYFGESTFGSDNKITFYVPAKNASAGQGSFTSQSNKRISYSFTIKKAYYQGNSLFLEVYGTLKNPSMTKSTERATIEFNKLTKKINIISDKFEALNMDANFVVGC